MKAVRKPLAGVRTLWQRTNFVDSGLSGLIAIMYVARMFERVKSVWVSSGGSLDESSFVALIR